jgi:histidyl-tRNA synthetase
VTRIKGFADMFPPASEAFTRMESCARSVFAGYGFAELRTPLLEHTELFCRSIGEETDVVAKEMFTFADRKDRSLTLRPEATAGVMRALIDDGCLAREAMSRFFTFGPMFRYERPQKGRMRQFHQINAECLGSDSPFVDAELIDMLLRYLGVLGIVDVILKLNSLGCAMCRPNYRTALSAYFGRIEQGVLCPDCLRRAAVNPLRVLDCKQSCCRAATQNAPKFIEYHCDSCARHFATVRDALRGRSFEIDHRLVRGLDYYCRTTFEVTSAAVGAQSAIAGGGRYDGLARSLGGPDVPGVGFACGMERMALLLPKAPVSRPDFYLLAMDAELLMQSFVFVRHLRENGLRGICDVSQGSFKNRMRQAGKSEARFCLIIGSDEAADATVTVKTLDSGEQARISQACAAQYMGAAS